MARRFATIATTSPRRSGHLVDDTSGGRLATPREIEVPIAQELALICEQNCKAEVPMQCEPADTPQEALSALHH